VLTPVFEQLRVQAETPSEELKQEKSYNDSIRLPSDMPDYIYSSQQELPSSKRRDYYKKSLAVIPSRRRPRLQLTSEEESNVVLSMNQTGLEDDYGGQPREELKQLEQSPGLREANFASGALSIQNQSPAIKALSSDRISSHSSDRPKLQVS